MPIGLPGWGAKFRVNRLPPLRVAVLTPDQRPRIIYRAVDPFLNASPTPSASACRSTSTVRRHASPWRSSARRLLKTFRGAFQAVRLPGLRPRKPTAWRVSAGYSCRDAARLPCRLGNDRQVLVKFTCAIPIIGPADPPRPPTPARGQSGISTHLVQATYLVHHQSPTRWRCRAAQPAGRDAAARTRHDEYSAALPVDRRRNRPTGDTRGC